MRSRWRILVPIGIAASLGGAATAQNLEGIDPVKVKTIPMGAKEAAPVPPYPRTPTTVAPLKSSSPGLDLPATKVKTLRVDRKGHVLGKVDGAHLR